MGGDKNDLRDVVAVSDVAELLESSTERRSEKFLSLVSLAQAWCRHFQQRSKPSNGGKVHGNTSESSLDSLCRGCREQGSLRTFPAESSSHSPSLISCSPHNLLVYLTLPLSLISQACVVLTVFQQLT